MTSGPRDGQQKRGQVTPAEAEDNVSDAAQGSSPPADNKRLRAEYPVTLQKGQRRYGPPPEWEDMDPPRGTEIFVSKIPKDMLEDELVPVFQQAGPIYEVRLMMETSLLNKGFAFVKYCKLDDAESALNHLNCFEIRPGCPLSVTKSIDNNRIFIGNIPKNFTSGDLFAHMSKMTSGVAKVILYPSVNDRAKNRGYGFVQYESHQQAATARQKLMASPTLWSGHEVKVDWAEPEIAVDEEVMKTVKVLYVRNLALDTTEQQLEELFGGCGGQIERVRKLHDYAFIHFATREQAEDAKNKFHGITVDGCEIDISWSKPVNNKEEYQQRKAMSKAMYRGPNAPLAAGLSMHGEPFLLNQRLRNAAGSQGFGPKHIFNKLKQCETPLSPMHPALLAPNNLITCNVAMKSHLEVGLTSGMPYGVEKLTPEETMAPTAQDIVAQQAFRNSWIAHQYMVPPVAPAWNNQNPYAGQLHPGQNFVPAPYLVQPTYPVFESPYNAYTCQQFYPGAPVLTSVPGISNTALNVCNETFTPR